MLFQNVLLVQDTLSFLVSLTEAVDTCDTESQSTAQYKVHTDPARVEPPTTEAHNDLIVETGTAAHFIQTTVCTKEIRLPHFDTCSYSKSLPILLSRFYSSYNPRTLAFLSCPYYLLGLVGVSIELQSLGFYYRYGQYQSPRILMLSVLPV